MVSLVRTAVVLAVWTSAAVVAEAQSFSGSGSRETPLFTLPQGVAVFNVDYIGSGRFTIRLLDAQAIPVSTLVDVRGQFSGSPAVELPENGQYRFDVVADGAWNIQLKPGTSAAGASVLSAEARQRAQLFTEGRTAGEEAAETGWRWGWFARGLVGGTVAGPIGTVVTMGLAGRSGVDVPREGLAGREPPFEQGYREGFAAHARAQRREAAFVGGLLGTGILTVILIQVLDLDFLNQGGGSGGPNPNPV